MTALSPRPGGCSWNRKLSGESWAKNCSCGDVRLVRNCSFDGDDDELLCDDDFLGNSVFQKISSDPPPQWCDVEVLLWVSSF